ncbi:MAG: amino acid ABC transporter ATP-binding protein, partial [Dermatophilaceae bacterium]
MTDAPSETNPADSTDSTDSADVVTSTAATHRPLVVLEKVNKHFGELHVLKDIDLTIGEGEVVV